MKVSFWGSTNFSLDILKAIHQKALENKLELSYVVSKPAALFGRKKELRQNPVAQYCFDSNITLYTPEKPKELYETSDFKLQTVDLSVVAAYGKIIPQSILDSTTFGFINFHGSILPKYRGAIPVQMTIKNQEDVGGISVIKMDIGMDTGDVIKNYELSISHEWTAGELMEKLGKLSARKIDEDFDILFNPEKWHSQKQDSLQATVCYEKELEKEYFKITYEDSILAAHGKIMAGNPQPKAWIRLIINNKELRVNLLRSSLKQKVKDLKPLHSLLLRTENNCLFLELRNGFLQILQIQPEGKPEMDAKAFLNGYRKLIKN